MSMDDKCAGTIKAAAEMLSETGCEGKYKGMEIGDGLLAWLSKEKLEEMGIDPRNPNPNREEAIESCMKGEWASEIAQAMTGSNPSEETLNQIKRNLCEGLVED